MKVSVYLGATLILLSAFGCSRPKVQSGTEIRPDGTVIQTGPRIEAVWVDPQIVATDQEMTLIRSDRVDSVEVSPDEINRPSAPAISFEVAEKSCWAAVDMLDSRGKVLSPLVHRQLGPGFYKVTLHKPPPAANPGVPYRYSLRVNVCGQTKAVQIGTNTTGTRNP